MSYSKFKAQRTSCGKHSHPSKGESSMCAHLQWLERAGEIEILKYQPNVFLTSARIRVIPDFLIRDNKTGEEKFIEFKGLETQSYKRNKRIWKFYANAPLVVYKIRNGRLFIAETITPIGETRNDV